MKYTNFKVKCVATVNETKKLTPELSINNVAIS